MTISKKLKSILLAGMLSIGMPARAHFIDNAISSINPKIWKLGSTTFFTVAAFNAGRWYRNSHNLTRKSLALFGATTALGVLCFVCRQRCRNLRSLSAIDYTLLPEEIEARLSEIERRLPRVPYEVFFVMSALYGIKTILN